MPIPSGCPEVTFLHQELVVVLEAKTPSEIKLRRKTICKIRSEIQEYIEGRSEHQIRPEILLVLKLNRSSKNQAWLTWILLWIFSNQKCYSSRLEKPSLFRVCALSYWS
jgi:hypothetical protein